MHTLQRRNGAFTIVELLIASTITVIIVVMLGTMFGSLSSTSLRSNQRIDAFRDARAALQMMQRDLAGVVKGQWDTRVAPPTPVTRPAAYLALTDRYADPAAGNQQVFALIATKNNGPSDVCSVGYYCRWDTNRQAYSLHRFFRNSAATYSALIGNATYISDADLYQPGATDDLLASYVWDLRIAAYDSAGAPLGYPYVSDSTATAPAVAPASLTISFKAMSSNAARAAVAAGITPNIWMDETDGDYQRLIQPHVYRFSSQIKL
jgi:type II secretory pathway pseudopilin PulG